MKEYQSYILIYLCGINILAFFMMGIDKFRAKADKFRIPESNLFLTAIIGGSIGSLLGMYTFRHKTRKRVFAIGMPVILLIQLIIAGWFIFLSPFKVVFL